MRRRGARAREPSTNEGAESGTLLRSQTASSQSGPPPAPPTCAALAKPTMPPRLGGRLKRTLCAWASASLTPRASQELMSGPMEMRSRMTQRKPSSPKGFSSEPSPHPPLFRRVGTARHDPRRRLHNNPLSLKSHLGRGGLCELGRLHKVRDRRPQVRGVLRNCGKAWSFKARNFGKHWRFQVGFERASQS